MELAVVQKEIQAWTPEEQDQLAAYLAVLRLKRESLHAGGLSRRLNDENPESWMTFDEVRENLRESD